MNDPVKHHKPGDIDFMQCWDNALHILAAKREFLVAIAGVFVLLPTLAMGLFIPPPDIGDNESVNRLLEIISAYYASNGIWFALASLITGYGSLAMLSLILGGSGGGDRSISQILGAAFRLYPANVIASFISGLAIFAGASLFILPGLYFYIKFCLTASVIADTDEKSPLTALRRSWALTNGNSIRIFFFLAIILLVAGIIYMITSGILGAIAALTLPENAAFVAKVVVDSVLSMALSIVMAVVMASLYRQLTNGPGSARLGDVFD